MGEEIILERLEWDGRAEGILGIFCFLCEWLLVRVDCGGDYYGVVVGRFLLLVGVRWRHAALCLMMMMMMVSKVRARSFDFFEQEDEKALAW